jgi:uncharacterized protein YsxB (DUF464 family)
MIEAIFWETKEKALRGFRVQGHAGYAPAGEDIVCAGVSVLVQTAAAALQKFLACPPLLEKSPVRAGEICVELRLPEILTDEEMSTAQVILETMEIGMLGIACSYEKYLEVRRCCDDDHKRL